MARIALDIDSTLHHYWDLLDGLAQQHFGVRLPYEEQHGWGIERLEPSQLKRVIDESHSDENIETAEPYPHAVETVRRWHGEGHWIHITSHRAPSTREATVRWLDRIGMPFHDLHCSYDKVTRCVELGIDVLVDDSPVNLENAREQGILAATIIHPWNAEIARSDGVVGGRDWGELAQKLEPVLQRLARA
jgi:5'(3')-deoxyribonucleotidase